MCLVFRLTDPVKVPGCVRFLGLWTYPEVVGSNIVILLIFHLQGSGDLALT